MKPASEIEDAYRAADGRYAYVGKSVRRVEDKKLLLGKGRYVDDINPSGCLYLGFVRSTHAHANILSVDLAAVRAKPGVVGAWSAADFGDELKDVMPVWQLPGSKIKGVPVLARDRVRYVGERVVAVLVSDKYDLEDAMELVQIEYEALPAVTDELIALTDPDAPLVHEDIPGNLSRLWKVGGGSFEKACAKADHIIELKLKNQRLHPNFIETRGCVAIPDPIDERMTLYLSCQAPHVSRRLICEMIGLDEHKLRVIAPDVGGGFGPKMPLYGEEVFAVFIADRLKQPVKWIETRTEHQVATTNGRVHSEVIKAAVRSDGRLLGLKVDMYAGLGAYLANFALGIPTINSVSLAQGCYDVRDLELTAIMGYQNTMSVDVYRGAGRPEAAYIADRLMDAIAHQLNLDRIAVRRLNFIKPDQFPYVMNSGPAALLDSGDYERALDRALEMADYEGLLELQSRKRAEGKLFGIGIATFTEIVGMAPSHQVYHVGIDRGGWEYGSIKVNPTGKVTVLSGSSAHGQGHRTTFAQVVADALQIPMSDIEVIQSDTDKVPYGHGTFNSRSIVVGGAALKVAADKVVTKAKKIAAFMMEASEEDIELIHGKFQIKGDPSAFKTFGEVAKQAYLSHNLPLGMEPNLEEKHFWDPVTFTAPFGAHIVAIEVDEHTGEIDILKYVAVDDIGNMLNPLLVEGQAIGGIVQGLGQALMEWGNYDSEGQPLAGSLLDYALPKADQMPDIITGHTITPSPVNPLGVKGIGESGCIGAPIVMASALSDALKPFGIHHVDMPFTPPRVWAAIQDAKKSKEAV